MDDLSIEHYRMMLDKYESENREANSDPDILDIMRDSKEFPLAELDHSKQGE